MAVLTDITEATHAKDLSDRAAEDLQVVLATLGYYKGAIDQIVGDKTLAALKQFKQEHYLEFPEKVGKTTIKTLLEQQKEQVGFILAEAENPNKNQVISDIVNACHQLGLLLTTQKAYVIATVDHETNQTFKPVREAYWLDEAWRKRNLRYYPYYGRGYVQLTWQGNYQRYQDQLSLPLLDQPDLVMRHDVAVYVLVHGSKNGIFAGTKIEDFINENQTDYLGARQVINDMDRADEIAKLAKQWEEKITAFN